MMGPKGVFRKGDGAHTSRREVFRHRTPGRDTPPLRPFSPSLYKTGMSARQGPRRPTGLSMINDVYNARILALAADIPRLGRLAAPQASARAHSRLCGSTVTIDLVMDGDQVVDFAHEVRACALGQASSSLMASHVIGATSQELREVRETMWKMLRENGPPPTGRWHDFKVLEPVRDYKARHASTMLTFDAVVDAIGQIEAARAAAE